MNNTNYRESPRSFLIWCSTFTPSDADKPDLLLSTCAGGVNRQALSVTFSSRSISLTIDQVKTLLDKAGERAH
jgi:hypothetical protein